MGCRSRAVDQQGRCSAGCLILSQAVLGTDSRAEQRESKSDLDQTHGGAGGGEPAGKREEREEIRHKCRCRSDGGLANVIVGIENPRIARSVLAWMPVGVARWETGAPSDPRRRARRQQPRASDANSIAIEPKTHE
ncbi:MAG: hypothetical protein ACI835_003824 [Planctomycetota bacterium]